MKMAPHLPLYMIGGVIAYHPFLSSILSTKLGKEIKIVEQPQFVVSYGAATIARQTWELQDNEQKPAAGATLKIK
jgi:activator of 2-hydroxyglutaryl-CoA dehydratase